jgi:O-acetyl-ADP-ribose deacetylase (regulator of RNase III)
MNIVMGDATLPIHTPAVIAHVVNDQGGWGAGFTGAITRRFGSAPRDRYKIWVRYVEMGDIDMLLVQGDPEVYIANMLCQQGYKSRTNPVPLSYKYLDMCLSKLYEEVSYLNHSVHMPMIGSGLAGGDWNRIEDMIKHFESVHGVSTTIYQLEV